MTTRERLPDRRRAESFALEAGGLRYTATVGRFDDGRLAEIFLTSNKVGSGAATAACDAAVLASIALQHGVPVDVLRRALMRDPQGRAIGPLGAALDRIAPSALREALRRPHPSGSPQEEETT